MHLSKQQKKDITQWDIANWSKALDFWKPYLQKVKGKKAAAFGEREGGLSLWLALNGLEVECSDYNEFKNTPLTIHSKYSISDHIHYSKQDITSIQFPDNSFDVVLFKSVMGSLGDKQKQEKAFQALYRILKPGGYLLFAENLTSTKLHRFARKRFTGWGANWRYITIDESKNMLHSFNEFTFQTRGFLAAFGRTEKQRNFLGKLDSLLHPILPKRWKYILFGVCRK